MLRQAVGGASGGLPPLGGFRTGSNAGHRRRKNYTPAEWSEYFDEKFDVETERGTFRMYRRAGHWAEGDAEVLCLHGAGYSGTSWALMSEAVTQSSTCAVSALDLRYHGDSMNVKESGADADTSVASESEEEGVKQASGGRNFTMEEMANDVVAVVQGRYGDSPPPLVLVGHSMGGALASHIGGRGLLPTVVGVVVIDVVEGTALSALSAMSRVLSQRPRTFTSLEQGIEWSVRSGQTSSAESARVSMPGQLHQTAPDEFGWRVNLYETEPYWRGWFTGLTDNFLASPSARLLIVAGMDRLDTALTVAQMQGKFQMHVFPQCGHCVHEDAPDKVAGVLTQYLLRYRFGRCIDRTVDMPSIPVTP